MLCKKLDEFYKFGDKKINKDRETRAANEAGAEAGARHAKAEAGLQPFDVFGLFSAIVNFVHPGRFFLAIWLD